MSDKDKGYVTRETILDLLSDEEAGWASIDEEASFQLDDGDEFLDLEHLDKGVQRVGSSNHVPEGDILPRKAVSAETWSKIVAKL